MFRSILRMNVATATTAKTAASRAMSAATGKAYPAAMAETLDKMGFASDLWLTEAQMKPFGLAVSPAQKEKGFTSKGSKDGVDFMIYNADQTTDPAKVGTLKGRIIATYALTGTKVGGDVASALTASAAKFPTNEWLSEKDVKDLTLALKPNATPVSVTYKVSDKTVLPDGKESVTEREVAKVFYNVADVANPEDVAAAKLYPVSAKSGEAFPTHFALPLLRAAIANKYTSPFWTSLNRVQAMGLSIKDASAGVEITLSDSKVLTFFNADQTSNAAKFVVHAQNNAYKAKFQPRSAMSGKVYDGPAKTALSTAAMKNRHSSVYCSRKSRRRSWASRLRPARSPP